VKIAFITTVRHNVGDDFVREGLEFLLRRHFAGQELEFESIHKHAPITARHGFEWLRSRPLATRLDPLLPLGLTRDRVLEADLLVQSGAPVYWVHDGPGGHCADNEWYRPLVERRFGRKPGARLLNLAAGSCQPYHSDGSEFRDSPRDRAFMVDFARRATLTTVRDALSQRILAEVGVEAELIPCTSIFARDQLGLEKAGDEFVILNYMPSGAHYRLGQAIDDARWEREFGAFQRWLGERERVVLACHDRKELGHARRVAPDAEHFHSERHEDYLELYSRAKLAIVNRVHAAFTVASFGTPAFIVGNDTRARMGREIGVDSVFVGEASADGLKERYDALLAGRRAFAERTAEIRKRALEAYLGAFRRVGLQASPPGAPGGTGTKLV
jgi:hypothetical protein